MVSLKQQDPRYNVPSFEEEKCPCIELCGEVAAKLGLDKLSVGTMVTMTVKAVIQEMSLEKDEGVCVELEFQEAEVIKAGKSTVKTLYGEDD